MQILTPGHCVSADIRTVVCDKVWHTRLGSKCTCRDRSGLKRKAKLFLGIRFSTPEISQQNKHRQKYQAEAKSQEQKQHQTPRKAIMRTNAGTPPSSDGSAELQNFQLLLHHLLPLRFLQCADLWYINPLDLSPDLTLKMAVYVVLLPAVQTLREKVLVFWSVFVNSSPPLLRSGWKKYCLLGPQSSCWLLPPRNPPDPGKRSHQLTATESVLAKKQSHKPLLKPFQ